MKDYLVSGSIVGANPESVVGSRQVNTLMGARRAHVVTFENGVQSVFVWRY